MIMCAKRHLCVASKKHNKKCKAFSSCGGGSEGGLSEVSVDAFKGAAQAKKNPKSHPVALNVVDCCSYGMNPALPSAAYLG